MLSSRRAAAVLLSVILGCSAVAGCSTTPKSDLPAPPWKRGQEITPVSTTNAEVASASRRDQWVQAWLALRPLGDGSSEQVDGETNFDQNLIKAGAGYRAGLSVIRTADPALTLSFAEFDTADHARAQLAKWTAAGAKASEHPATIPGTQQAKAYTQPTGTTPCQVARGNPIDVSVRFLVADRIAVDLRQSCVSSARSASVITDLSGRAADLVFFAVKMASAPMPSKWFDRATGNHILSNGTWNQQQYVIAGRTDGIDLDHLLPPPFPGTGVQVAFDAYDYVMVYVNTAAAQQALLRLREAPQLSWWKGSYRTAPQPQAALVGDEQYCAEGLHYHEERTCWTQVGRYIDISHTKYNGHWPDERQLENLRG